MNVARCSEQAGRRSINALHQILLGDQILSDPCLVCFFKRTHLGNILDVALAPFAAAVTATIRHPSGPKLNISKFPRWTTESRCRKEPASQCRTTELIYMTVLT